MAALDGKITIERELRPCIVHVPAVQETYYKGEYLARRIIEPEHEVNTLFHCWHPVTRNAIVEYEDGTIHEVEPTQIRFVDNVMSEYAFPQMEREQFMCICENANNRKIPVGRAGIIKTKYGYFEGFNLDGYKPEETAVPIAYCPFCGRDLPYQWREKQCV